MGCGTRTVRPISSVIWRYGAGAVAWEWQIAALENSTASAAKGAALSVE